MAGLLPWVGLGALVYVGYQATQPPPREDPGANEPDYVQEIYMDVGIPRSATNVDIIDGKVYNYVPFQTFGNLVSFFRHQAQSTKDNNDDKKRVFNESKKNTLVQDDRPNAPSLFNFNPMYRRTWNDIAGIQEESESQVNEDTGEVEGNRRVLPVPLS